MKKIVFSILAIGAIFANAAMTESQRGTAMGLGTGHAIEINMSNPNFAKEDLAELCSKRIKNDSMVNSDEVATMAINECVSQLKKIESTRK